MIHIYNHFKIGLFTLGHMRKMGGFNWIAWQTFFLQPPSLWNSRLNLLGCISTSETACLMRLHELGSPCLIAPWSTEGQGTWKIKLALAFLDICVHPMYVDFLEVVELTTLNTNWKPNPFIPPPLPQSDCRAIRKLLFLRLILEIRCGDCTQEQQ